MHLTNPRPCCSACAAHTTHRSLTTSPQRPEQQPSPRASAQADGSDSRPQTPSTPRSPALSTASTADAGPSPPLPALRAPQLPERVLALLRTPPASSRGASDDENEDNEDNDDDDDDECPFVTTSWGSPYPRSETSHLQSSSLSSETSEDSPIHHLELHTPFLRPVPFITAPAENDNPDSARQHLQLSLSSPLHLGISPSLVSAAILANRARRPARGITEDWIRQHTTGDIGSEARLWLSDSSEGDSENSSLSGSVLRDTPAWSGEDEYALRTPRAVPASRASSRSSHTTILHRSQTDPSQKRQLRRRLSSTETLRESDVNRLHRPLPVRKNSSDSNVTMTAQRGRENAGTAAAAGNMTATASSANMTTQAVTLEKLSSAAQLDSAPVSAPVLAPGAKEPSNSIINNAHSLDAVTHSKPSQASASHASALKSPAKDRAPSRRSKKKVPWKGKTIVVLLPVDEDRGKPGHAPAPLPQSAVDNMRQSWKELGYDIEGFDLYDSDAPAGKDIDSLDQSMSRSSWPTESDIVRERSLRKYPVLLPDLNAWKNYVAELNEAKLRALGVSFAGDEPPLPPLPPSVSPGVGASISRQSSTTMYPPLPFSPPIPTSSASSNRGASGFTFPAAFIPGHSPSMSSVASPVPFNIGSKYNARQSISIPAGAFQLPNQQQATPGGFSPQALFLQHGLARGGSPSLAALSSVMSPVSPFSPDGFPAPPIHQRHQSLQYPLLQHQLQLQLQSSARASPRLQDLAEVDERTVSETPAKIPEPLAAGGPVSGPASAPFVQHNASLSLQKEIDDAEYHLEEQFRSQFEHDRAYSPHGERQLTESFNVDGTDKPTAPMHAQAHDLSVQFAPPPPIQRFRDDTENGPPLHHPRPHSRGHSLANAYYADADEMRQNGSATFTQSASLIAAQNAAQDSAAARADDAYEIETNPSNLGTPTRAHARDFSSGLQDQHQRSFSTASNPWGDSGSFSVKPDAAKRSSHGSKGSLSRFNVEAPEFKFNPASAGTFKSSFGSQFSFGNGANEAFQPSVFHTGLVPSVSLSASSSQFSFPMSSTTAPTKINASAPAFSPGQSDFSFSAAGPKFRPDAPAFTPLHFSDSVTSPIQSGPESVAGGHLSSSIFGNIDLSIPSADKPTTKRSKAVPIVRPTSRNSPVDADREAEPQEDDKQGQVMDDSRIKRARATPKADDDDEVLFAEPTIKGGPSADKPEVAAAAQPAADETAELANDEASNLAAEDSTLSSTAASESTDAKMAAATSPSEVSPLQAAVPWTAFEFRSDADIASFNNARPMGDTIFGHKKSLSATAKPFMPRGSLFSDLAAEEGPAESVEERLIPSTEIADDAELVKVQEAVANGFDKSQAAYSAQQQQKPPPPPPANEKPKGLSASRYASSPPPPPPPPKTATALPSPQFMASSPPPVPRKDGERFTEVFEVEQQQELDIAAAESDLAEVEDQEDEPALAGDSQDSAAEEHEPTFEEIDDIMSRLNNFDSEQGVHAWGHAQTPAAAELPRQMLLSTEGGNAFVDSPRSVSSSDNSHDHDGKHDGGAGSMPVSEWERDFSDEEQLKLESRISFFDGRVNDVVGGLLAARLGPLEESLEHIQHAVTSILGWNGPSRRSRRSISGEVRESDADDEDEEVPVSRRSVSPRKDRRLEQIRAIVLDALALHQQNERMKNASVESPVATAVATAMAEDVLPDASVATILKSLDDVKEQFGQSLRLDFRGEDLRNIVEEAVERRMQLTRQPVASSHEEEEKREEEEEQRGKVEQELQARIAELEQRLQAEEAKTESEVSLRRTAEDMTAELQRKLVLAETKIEVEIMNRSAYDQRVTDLEDRLRHQEEKTEAEVDVRRSAEDRLSEVQRLLRISSEEETRLREALEERGQQARAAEEAGSTSLMRMAMLEAAQARDEATHSDLQSRANATEAELREKVQEARHWRAEAERAIDLSQRQGDDLLETATELRHVKRVVDTLGTQLEENERLREAWRNKFVALQEDMAQAAREVAEESARHIRREQTLLARQEVLEAKLQAEARTRERLEGELERLEGGERQAMRAVAECKRLEAMLGELRTANEELQQSVRRYQAEFGEARESAAREVQRTRDTMQAEVEAANYEVNAVRRELEDQVAQARGQVDQVRLDADTARARLEMLLEEAEATKRTAVEDLQARYERQVQNAVEDAQRTEQNLLERLSISTSKTELLQDRVVHLEEKLEVAREAAREAAQAAARATKEAKEARETAEGGGGGEGEEGTRDKAKAKTKTTATATTTTNRSLQPAATVMAAATTAATMMTTSTAMLGLPEKISPQALRESIMVLQEQLQQREQRIETLEQTLEQTLAKTDPDAEAKMAKRDDEIVWLRELLAVRHADLQDIVTALGRDDHDPERVRDAAIRLQANLQMEEQERERAVNGGSAITLPTLAASIRDAATPRVAQAVLPLAAAWGNWRRGRDSSASNASGASGASNAAAAAAAAAGAFSSISSVLTSSPLSASASVSAASSPVPAAASRQQLKANRGASRLTARSAAATPSRMASLSTSSSRGTTSNGGGNGGNSGNGGSGDSATATSSFLSGLPTPPTSSARQQQQQQQQQPTAFASTGRRYANEQPVTAAASTAAASRRLSRSDSKLAARHVSTPSPPSSQPPTAFRRSSRSHQAGHPVTPPMMRTAVYDSDAQAEEFDDAAFYDD